MLASLYGADYGLGHAVVRTGSAALDATCVAVAVSSLSHNDTVITAETMAAMALVDESRVVAHVSIGSAPTIAPLGMACCRSGRRADINHVCNGVLDRGRARVQCTMCDRRSNRAIASIPNTAVTHQQCCAGPQS